MIAQFAVGESYKLYSSGTKKTIRFQVRITLNIHTENMIFLNIP